MMEHPTIGLVMIVRNEAATLPRLAASLDGQINRWTVVDTGSDDNTPDVVRKVFAGVPGVLLYDTWRGFGPSRNVALEAARHETTWLLILDADELVVGQVRDCLEPAAGLVDGFEAEIRNVGLHHFAPRLLASTASWVWRGRTHEYLTLSDREPLLEQATSFHVVHHADGGGRAGKFERDLSLLETDLEEHPDDARTVFYLARTYEDRGEHATAARCYRRRLELPGWDEEAWYARWRLGACELALGHGGAAADVLLHAWDQRPWRAEPLWTLAEHYRATGRWQLAWEMGTIARRYTAARPDGRGPDPSGDRLFVHDDVYRWRMAYERSIAAYYVEQHSVGRTLCDYLLRQDLPDAISQSVVANQAFYR